MSTHQQPDQDPKVSAKMHYSTVLALVIANLTTFALAVLFSDRLGANLGYFAQLQEQARTQIPRVEAAGLTYYVRSDGSDSGCNGFADAAYPGSGTGQNCSFQVIQKAVDSITPGDDILIGPGIYASFTIWGNAGGTPGHPAAVFQAPATNPTVISGASASSVSIDPGAGSAAVYSYGSTGSSGATSNVTLQRLHLKGGINAAVYFDNNHTNIAVKDVLMDNFQQLGGSAAGTTNGGRHAGGMRDAAVLFSPNYIASNVLLEDITIVGGPYYCATSQSGVATQFCGVDASAIQMNGTGTIRRVYAEKFLGNFLLRAPQNGIVESNTIKDFYCDSDDGCIQLYNVANATIRYNTFISSVPINDVLAVIRLRRSNVCTTMPSVKVYNNTFIGNTLMGARGTKKVFDVAQPTYCESVSFCTANPAIGTNAGCSNLSLIPIGAVLFKNNIIMTNFGRSATWGALGGVYAEYCPPSGGTFVYDNNLYYNDLTNYTITTRTDCNTLYGPFESHSKINIDPLLDATTFAPATGSPACTGGDASVDANQGAAFIGAKPCVGSLTPSMPTVVCGNGIVEGTEQCDAANLGGASCTSKGFTGGTLGCTASCLFDTSACTTTPAPTCGNGIVETGEQCDGTNLGGVSCTTQGFLAGTLSCSATCQFNTSVCVNIAPSQQGTTVSISNAFDNQITGPSGDDALWNRGGYPTVAVGKTAAGQQRTLIKFDVSSIPAGSSVVSATLKLTCVSAVSGTTNNAIQAYPLLRSWNEGSASTFVLNNASSWLYSDYPTTWAGAGASASGDHAVNAIGSQTISTCSNTAYSIILSPQTVSNWLSNPNQNYGMVLVGDESVSTSNKIIASSENPTTAYRPQLIVVYIAGTQMGPVCGNGILETGEQCDGSNFNSATCQTWGFASGSLSCSTSCQYNTLACVAAVPALSAPVNLSARALSKSQIKLTWTDTSSNETSFDIEMQTSPTSFMKIGSVGANTTSYTVSNLIANSSYYFRVRAVNATMASGYSNTAGTKTKRK